MGLQFLSVVNHKYKHIFIHNPKTAGTSMESCKFVGGNGHAPIRALKPQAPDYFSWSFVRHPMDRLFSAYVGLKQYKSYALDIPLTFEQFIFETPESSCSEVRKHVIPQFEFLTIDDRIAIDFVGRFERLYVDWKHVCEVLSIETIELPQINRNTRKCYMDAYTGAMKQHIYQIYEKDFYLFEYRIP